MPAAPGGAPQGTPAARLAHVASPDDPALARLAGLLARTFADPDVVLDLSRLREFVAAPPADRRFHVIAAVSQQEVVGGTVFSYVPAANCGLSEYIVVAPEWRRHGLGRRLIDARHAALDEDARRHGHTACRGLFIEVENPDRTPADVLESERETAMDARDRRRLFHALGFRRVDVPYVQPSLAPGKRPVDYLDLLFLPWDESARQDERLPAQWLLDAVEPIWASWTPGTYETHWQTLRDRLGGRDVALLPLLQE